MYIFFVHNYFSNTSVREVLLELTPSEAVQRNSDASPERVPAALREEIYH